MARFPKARPRHDQSSHFMSTAKMFYNDAFGSSKPSDLAESMADWGELNADEQSFTVAHLHYLGLLAQAGTQRLLRQMVALLEGIEEGVDELALPGEPGLLVEPAMSAVSAELAEPPTLAGPEESVEPPSAVNEGGET